VDSTLQSVIRLYLHPGTPEGEKANARAKVELLANKAGLTFAQAITAHNKPADKPDHKTGSAGHTSWEEAVRDGVKEGLRQAQAQKEREASMWEDKNRKIREAVADAYSWKRAAQDAARNADRLKGETIELVEKLNDLEKKVRNGRRLIPLDQIRVGSASYRDVAGPSSNDNLVSKLASSMKEIGQINPITVRWVKARAATSLMVTRPSPAATDSLRPRRCTGTRSRASSSRWTMICASFA
jgi:hypothetical protein